jgi:hypothetical protein
MRVHMEVVLLWLDDLDDLVFTLALDAERLRCLCLKIGLLSAFGLAACELAAGVELAAGATRWSVPLARLTIACVGVWLFSAAIAVARRFEPSAV